MRLVTTPDLLARAAPPSPVNIRRARQRFLIAAGGLAGLVFTATACSGSDETLQARPPAASPAPSETDNWCSDRRENVTCITAESGLQGVVYRGDPASRSLVVWDPGGPGLGLPDADANLAVLVPRAIRDRNVLLVVEPWARDRPPDRCLRSAFENEPDHTCHLSRLTTSSRGIEATLALAESQTGLIGVGAYLQSFGATRSLSAVTQPSGPDVSWVVLESPGPPPGSDALDLMTARKQVMLRLLVHRCGAVECGNRVRHSMDRLARDGVGVQTTGREFALGLIALATLPQDNDRLLTAVSEQLSSGKISSQTASQLRLLGRLYEGKRPGRR